MVVIADGRSAWLAADEYARYPVALNAGATRDLRLSRATGFFRGVRCVDEPVCTERARFCGAEARRAQQVAGTLAGRYPAELGIDVDAGDAEVEWWFLARGISACRAAAWPVQVFGGLPGWRKWPESLAARDIDAFVAMLRTHRDRRG